MLPKVFIQACVAFACMAVAGDLTPAGEYNQKLSIGDAAPQWKDLPGVDDEKHSLEQLKAKQAVVVVFTCNSCPYAVDVEDRLIALHEKYAKKGVAVVAINVNKIAADALPAMKDKAKEKKFPFAYLYDETQQIGRDFGAIFTPEFYVLNRKREVVYMGALDDSPEGKSVTKHYVEDAIGAVLTGESPKVAETPSVGCRVRWERKRRVRRTP